MPLVHLATVRLRAVSKRQTDYYYESVPSRSWQPAANLSGSFKPTISGLPVQQLSYVQMIASFRRHSLRMCPSN